MSKQANPTAVGIFVVGAILLAATMIIMVGTEGMFDKKKTFVAYFKGNANGLSESSDVKIGGVKVGSVKSIHIMADPTTGKKLIPVAIELSGTKIATATGRDGDAADSIFKEGNFEEIIDGGLVASLKNASLLTGILYIDLDILPNEEAFTFEGESIGTLDEHLQIPTVGVGLDKAFASVSKMLENINSFDFEGISSQLKTLLADVDTVVNEIKAEELSNSAVGLIEDARLVVNDAKLKSAIANLDASMVEMRGVAEQLNGKMSPITEQVEVTLARAAEAMEKARDAASGAAAILNPEAPMFVRVNRTLGELEQTSRSIRQLMDFLRQNPNALLTGKSRPR